MSRRNQDIKYLSFPAALKKVVDGLEFMAVEPGENIDSAMLQLRKIYTNTPSYVNDGEKVNYPGLAALESVSTAVAIIALENLIRIGDITLETAVELILDAREYQTKAWPSVMEPDRPFEEWVLLTQEYIYRVTEISKNEPLNTARIQKYAAIVANLALWMVQSAMGPDPADDGDEVALIRFFTRFSNGAAGGLDVWGKVAERVRPAGGGFTEITEA